MDRIDISAIALNNIIEYLDIFNWKNSYEKNDRWLVFTRKYGNDLFEIIFPKNINSNDMNLYMYKAINTLSNLDDIDPVKVVEKISNVDNDVLKIRNIKTDSETKLTIKLASIQMNKLKSLIAFSACSEQNPKPYFNNSQNSRYAKEMIEHYKFSHTFKGSFGFSIESHLINKSQQVQLFDSNEEYVIVPLERRVMERIVRGLIITFEAVNKNDLSVLIDKYPSGFNSNMCRSILKISDRHKEIEYEILWSPKIRLSEDIISLNDFLLNEKHYEYLDKAARELCNVEPPKIIEMIGHVYGVSSKGDPLKFDSTPRFVIVRWENREGKPIDVLIELNKNDYIKASQSHLEWNLISVKGSIQKVGQRWQLSEPHDFQIKA